MRGISAQSTIKGKGNVIIYRENIDDYRGTGSFGNAVLNRFLQTDIGDVRDQQSVKNAMHGVDYIFHAAALKQVPSCEFFPIEAVDRVLFAFEHGEPGDILVQKAPTCTIQTQAEAVCELFGVDKNAIKVIGIRHGETMGNIIAKSYPRMVKIKPDVVLVFGDTNSCLSVIDAKRLHIPIFHMEAGNRCKDECLPNCLQMTPFAVVSDSGTLPEENVSDKVVKII